jgi:glycosyltransferase involved in cell wall biosynthesis
VLLMVGAGDSPDDIERLRRHAARLGLDAAVRFTGLVPRAEIPAFIRAADVGVSPIRPIPLFEVSSPTKFVEMLGYGCPVVANDIPEQARILRESGGGVAVPYESRAFGDAIATLLADPEARRRMSAAGAAWVAEHRSLAVLTERLESALERICRPRRAGAEAE